MKAKALVFFVCSMTSLTSACNKQQANTKLQGTWKSKDGVTVLKITNKQFTLEDGGTPVPEDYFLKGDTILTSFEGNQPFTKFIIKQLGDHDMKLMFPDSVAIEFTH